MYDTEVVIGSNTPPPRSVSSDHVAFFVEPALVANATSLQVSPSPGFPARQALPKRREVWRRVRVSAQRSLLRECASHPHLDSAPWFVRSQLAHTRLIPVDMLHVELQNIPRNAGLGSLLVDGLKGIVDKII